MRRSAPGRPAGGVERITWLPGGRRRTPGDATAPATWTTTSVGAVVAPPAKPSAASASRRVAPPSPACEGWANGRRISAGGGGGASSRQPAMLMQTSATAPTRRRRGETSNDSARPARRSRQVRRQGPRELGRGDGRNPPGAVTSGGEVRNPKTSPRRRAAGTSRALSAGEPSGGPDRLIRLRHPAFDGRPAGLPLGLDLEGDPAAAARCP